MFYLYQSDDGRVTAIDTDLLQVKPVAAWFGEPIERGEPVDRSVAERLTDQFGGQIIDRSGVCSREPRQSPGWPGHGRDGTELT